MKDTPVMSVEEAGELLGLGRTAAYESIRRNEIPHLRFGRRIIVPRAAVLKMLEAAAQPNRVQ